MTHHTTRSLIGIVDYTAEDSIQSRGKKHRPQGYRLQAVVLDCETRSDVGRVGHGDRILWLLALLNIQGLQLRATKGSR